MSLLFDTIDKIKIPDYSTVNEAIHNLSFVLDDPSSLGEFYPLILKYVSITGSPNPELPKKCTIICVADHGVAEMNVSAYPQSTTLEMTKNYLISKGAVANALSNFIGSELLVFDLGIASLTEPLPELIDRRIAPGTKNFTKGPAMTREEAIRALETGIEIAMSCVENGYTCLLPGEMGIANTSSSSAIIASLCNLTAEETTGRGTNISDERLKVKRAVVAQALAVNQPDPKDGIDVLSKVGGFELGCIAGIILGAARSGALVILDGFNTGAAALIAQAIKPEVTHYLLGSHIFAEPTHDIVLAKLGLTPYMDMKFRLGEATGSSIAADLLDASIFAYNALVRPGRSKTTSGYLLLLPNIMPAGLENVPSRVLDEYLSDFPIPNKASMEACRYHLDNLAKPIYSLGYLEEIAIELAGILEEKKPPLGLNRTVIVLADNKPSGERAQLLAAFANYANAKCLVSILRHDQSPTAAWSYGAELAEEASDTDDIIGVAIHHDDAYLLNNLLTETGDLKYPPNELLSHVPESFQVYVSALTGLLLSAAKAHLLVVLDGEATEILARYIEELVPSVRPYILHVQPRLLQTKVKSDSGAIACLGFRLVDAALHILNDMKTFAEANVATAIDGEGKEKQNAK